MTAIPVPLPPPAIVRLSADPAAGVGSDRGAEPGAVAVTAVPATPHGGFVGHLLEAIAVNAGRSRSYARQTRGASWPLSLRLIAAEVLLVPTAWAFDLWGERFHGQGLPAVAGDFTSMAAIPAAERPLVPFRPPEPRVWQELSADVAFYGDVIRAATAARDFRLVCQACDALLDTVDRLQARHGLPLSMTRHVVESLGFAAVHALELGQRSQGATDGLYETFLGLQAMGITAGVDLDRAAVPVQARGVGIVVNDLPQIPFREAWESYRRTTER